MLRKNTAYPPPNFAQKKLKTTDYDYKNQK